MQKYWSAVVAEPHCISNNYNIPVSLLALGLLLLVIPLSSCPITILCQDLFSRFSCDKVYALMLIKIVINTWGWMHCREKDRRGPTLNLDLENVLFITKGQTGNTICGMFSFGQLCGWMLRFGVTHTVFGRVSFRPPHPDPPHPTRNLQLPPLFILLRFCFISQELFYKLICQAAQMFIEPHETKLRKTVAGKLSFLYKERDYRSLDQVLKSLYRGQLQQTSSIMRNRSLSFRIKVGL